MNGVAGYIYRITNNINKKWYIGSSRGATTLNLAKRHTEYMGSGIYLNNAYKKYGIENFTKDILCIAEDWLNLKHPVVNNKARLTTYMYDHVFIPYESI